MAGAVKEKYGPKVRVDVIYKGFLGLGNKGDDGVKPPNLFVDEIELGKNPSQAELEKIVAQKLGN